MDIRLHQLGMTDDELAEDHFEPVLSLLDGCGGREYRIQPSQLSW